jgi:hypothetical protein
MLSSVECVEGDVDILTLRKSIMVCVCVGGRIYTEGTKICHCVVCV